MQTLISLKPWERALFDSISRLLSCLVVEQLVPAYYQPLKHAGASGSALLLRNQGVPYHSENVLAVALLHHSPIFNINEDHALGRTIGLLQPTDMSPLIFEIGESKLASEVSSTTYNRRTTSE